VYQKTLLIFAEVEPHEDGCLARSNCRMRDYPRCGTLTVITGNDPWSGAGQRDAFIEATPD
jgi:hypothetical protein